MTPSGISSSGCFNTGIFQDIEINNEVTSIEIKLQALENYISLSEIKLYIGRDTGDFNEKNTIQDSARTWLVPEDDAFEFDFLHISGSAHVGILPESSHNGSMVVNEMTGDHTGSLHVGSQQMVNISAQGMRVLPFNIQTYKVFFNNRIHGFYAKKLFFR